MGPYPKAHAVARKIEKPGAKNRNEKQILSYISNIE
jgi:hypothetical protein